MYLPCIYHVLGGDAFVASALKLFTFKKCTNAKKKIKSVVTYLYF